MNPKFSTESNLTIIFVDGDARVFAQDLIRYSDYFKSMVSGGFKESNDGVIDLRDRGEKKSEFLEFLKCFKPGKSIISDSNVVYLSNCATYYQVKFLKELCEDWLVSHANRINERTFINEIKFAKKNNFMKYFHVCTNTLSCNLHWLDIPSILNLTLDSKDVLNKVWKPICLRIEMPNPPESPPNNIKEYWYLIDAAKFKPQYNKLKRKFQSFTKGVLKLPESISEEFPNNQKLDKQELDSGWKIDDLVFDKVKNKVSKLVAEFPL